MDKIIITGLEIHAVIGVLPEERTKNQLLVLDIILFTDLENAGRTDDIVHTVDYREISEEVRKLIKQGRFRLIEGAARAAAVRCLQHEGVLEVTIKVKKPGALTGASNASCELHRTKEQLSSDNPDSGY